MPNGHGGVPRYGSPVLLLVLLAALLNLGLGQGWTWTVWPALVLVAAFAWRLSWHLHLYPLMEYGGAYASSEALRAAHRRHVVTTALLLPAAMGLVWWLWP